MKKMRAFPQSSVLYPESRVSALVTLLPSTSFSFSRKRLLRTMGSGEADVAISNSHM